MPKFAGLLVAALVAAAPVMAIAKTPPEPRKSIDLDRFMGRWYEILRTPNLAQSNCYAAYQVWSSVGQDKFSIDQVCHKDSVTGQEKHTQTPARAVDPQTNAKFEASFFGGLLKKEYWVLDHADDYSWMIASTAGGGFVAVLSRKPVMSDAEQTAMKNRITAMGFFDTKKLIAMGARSD